LQSSCPFPWLRRSALTGHIPRSEERLGVLPQLVSEVLPYEVRHGLSPGKAVTCESGFSSGRRGYGALQLRLGELDLPTDPASSVGTEEGDEGDSAT